MKCPQGRTLDPEVVPILVNYKNYYSKELKWMDASLVSQQD
jgi:hypothetical protein